MPGKTGLFPGKGAGCLILFALPFALVGIVVIGLVFSTMLAWTAMQSWEEVPAVLEQVEWVSSTSDDSTTYNVKAVYAYEWRGTRHQGTRVYLHTSSDNIGSFYQRVYDELTMHYEAGTPFRCFVNPEKPEEAVLYRNLRLEITGFLLLFGLIFGSVGLGLIAAALYGQRTIHQGETLRAAYPEEPWRWEKEWHEGIIHSHGKAKWIGTLIFALFWNAVSLPLLFIVPGEVRDGNTAALIALLFPLVGSIMAGFAVYFFLQWRRFGDVVFEMASLPGALGGQLRGNIRIPSAIMPDGEVSVILECVHKRTTGTGKNRSTSETILWQKEKSLTKNSLNHQGRATLIPVEVPIPYDQLPTDSSNPEDKTEWRLRSSATLPGVDFSASFTVPVFRTAEGDPNATTAVLDQMVPATITDENGEVITCYEPADPGETGDKLRKAGLRLEPAVGGGIALVFPMLRQPVAALGMLLFLIIWGGAVAFMLAFDAPIIFTLIFGLFFVVILYGTLDQWLGKSRVEINKNGIQVQGGLLGIGRLHHLSFDTVETIEMNKTMQSGNTLYYTVTIKRKGGGKQNVASRLKQEEAAAVIHALETGISDYK